MGKLASHKVRYVDQKFPSLRIVICQDSVVYKIPSKGIRDIHHDSFGRYPLGWLGHIDWEAVDRFHGSAWVPNVDCALEAIGAGHNIGGVLIICRLIFCSPSQSDYNCNCESLYWDCQNDRGLDEVSQRGYSALCCKGELHVLAEVYRREIHCWYVFQPQHVADIQNQVPLSRIVKM